MKLLAAAAAAGCVLTSAAALAAAASWKEYKADHFIIYYTKSEDFARRTAASAEGYYKKIADELGYPRYTNFWQWENRVKVYLYPDQAAYVRETGQPEWSHGVANYTTKEIRTYESSEGFLDGLLPHEIAHLVFRDFVGFKGEVPLWLDEGVAQWQEPAKRALAHKVTRWLLANDKDLVLDDLMALRSLEAKTPEEIHFFYMQAVSVVDFLVKTYGAQSFTEFCRQLRDGKRFSQALTAVYPVESVFELDQKWRKSAGLDGTPELEVYSG
jgi:hypothetical protein